VVVCKGEPASTPPSRKPQGPHNRFDLLIMAPLFGAVGLCASRKFQTDSRLIAVAELDACRFQSSTQLVNSACISRYRPWSSLDPFDGFQRDAGSFCEFALLDPKHCASRSDLFTGQHYALSAKLYT
jgi:hypothetical protein